MSRLFDRRGENNQQSGQKYHKPLQFFGTAPEELAIEPLRKGQKLSGRISTRD